MTTVESSNAPLATVVVLSGGLSHEREVSLRSGRRVATALRRAGHRVIESDMGQDVMRLLESEPDAVVFPLLHGGQGEDGTIREVLEVCGVGFVGSSGRASRIVFDKSIAGTVVAAAGVDVPDQIALPHQIFRDLGADSLVEAIGRRIGFPCVVKPASSGSALGMSRVEGPEALSKALVAAYAYGTTAVIERFVEGTEVAVTVLVGPHGRQVLPAVQIEPEGGVYDYSARYTAGATRFIVPAELDASTRDSLNEACLRAVEALQVTGIVRVDLIVDAQGVAWFLEANVAPGMTETSLVPLALQSAGLDLGEVCSRMVQEIAAKDSTEAGAHLPDEDAPTIVESVAEIVETTNEDVVDPQLLD